MPSQRSGVLRGDDLTGLAAFLGVKRPEVVVPPCWHWCVLNDPVDPKALDDRGQVRDSPLTPPPGVTRMFAGGRVHTITPLRLGLETTRTTELTRSIAKQGRHGPLRFVTLTTTWRQAGRTVLIDETDHVFMGCAPHSSPTTTPTHATSARPSPMGSDAAPNSAPADRPSPTGSGAAPNPAPADRPAPAQHLVEPTFQAPVAHRIDVDELTLVTFSALTANPYRIHWDRRFCAQAGHDGLVIHGPLQALWMAEQAFSGVDPANLADVTFSYRLTAPATAPAVMTVEPHQVRRPDGVVTAVMEVTVGGRPNS
ncbi:acyl dehydratase [Cutibacterium granulosum]|uniref:acyl dehydratase n=1 Tax=Cutibacterium granulosum TaxID=33011 RepID=UPI002B235D20|nr:acyl dehydratase [Cutibacterium granulosum]MEA5655559.1 acyl dehydratase [Cutibacterium granulosum]